MVAARAISPLLPLHVYQRRLQTIRMANVVYRVAAADNNHVLCMHAARGDQSARLLWAVCARPAGHSVRPRNLEPVSDGLLTNDTVLTGRSKQQTGDVDLRGVMHEIDDERVESAARGRRMLAIGAQGEQIFIKGLAVCY